MVVEGRSSVMALVYLEVSVGLSLILWVWSTAELSRGVVGLTVQNTDEGGCPTDNPS